MCSHICIARTFSNEQSSIGKPLTIFSPSTGSIQKKVREYRTLWPGSLLPAQTINFVTEARLPSMSTEHLSLCRMKKQFGIRAPQCSRKMGTLKMRPNGKRLISNDQTYPTINVAAEKSDKRFIEIITRIENT